jgi:hypothetical protein
MIITQPVIKNFIFDLWIFALWTTFIEQITFVNWEISILSSRILNKIVKVFVEIPWNFEFPPKLIHNILFF